VNPGNRAHAPKPGNHDRRAVDHCAASWIESSAIGYLPCSSEQRQPVTIVSRRATRPPSIGWFLYGIPGTLVAIYYITELFPRRPAPQARTRKTLRIWCEGHLLSYNCVRCVSPATRSTIERPGRNGSCVSKSPCPNRARCWTTRSRACAAVVAVVREADRTNRGHWQSARHQDGLPFYIDAEKMEEPIYKISIGAHCEPPFFSRSRFKYCSASRQLPESRSR
jgi:hypothetical protein